MNKLQGVHPKLVEIAGRIIAAMAALQFEVRVTDGVRTLEQQQALYRKGRTEPGAIVTNCDGVVKRSNHQAHVADGYGHAIDFAFFVDGEPSWGEDMPWQLLGWMAKSQGCRWGGDWKAPLVDRPHVEL